MSDAPADRPTHYKYTCRACQKEHLQPVWKNSPELTPIPKCCGRTRHMAFQGVATLPDDYTETPGA